MTGIWRRPVKKRCCCTAVGRQSGCASARSVDLPRLGSTGAADDARLRRAAEAREMADGSRAARRDPAGDRSGERRVTPPGRRAPGAMTDRAHFFAMAPRPMQRVLVGFARTRGSQNLVALDGAPICSPDSTFGEAGLSNCAVRGLERCRNSLGVEGVLRYRHARPEARRAWLRHTLGGKVPR